MTKPTGRDKAKRFFIGFNQTRLQPGYSDLNIALRNYNRRVHHQGAEHEITLIAESERGNRVELASNRTE